MTPTLSRYDSADYLDSDEVNAAYLDAALEDGDPALVMYALRAVARARGTAIVARNAGISCECLYEALNPDGNAEFSTVMREALVFRLPPVKTEAPLMGGPEDG